MPTNNKITERVFAAIAETGGVKGAYERFLSIDQELGFKESAKLKRLKDNYRILVQDIKTNIKVLAALEEIIIQIRAKEVINSDLRLSLSRDYIYARSTFYRRGNKINDIRVVVGKTTEFGVAPLFGTDLDKLIVDPNFRILCKEKLKDAMDKEIEANLNNLKEQIQIYENTQIPN